MLRKTHFLLLAMGIVFCSLLVREARATIVLFGNETLSYPSLDAAFTPQIPAAGILGEINIAEPLNGCSALDVNSTAKSAFVIVVRGDCLFETKVRNGQNAGFTVVIVFSNEDNDEVITMSGNGTGIRTFAVFVSKEAGDKLLSLEGLVHIYLLSDARKTTWTIKWLIISVSLIVMVIVGSLLAALCCIRRHILAEAEKNFFHEKLLNDDHYISSRESGLYDHGPEVQNAQDVMTYTEGEHNYVFRSEGPSDSDHASDTSNRTPPK